MGSKGKHRSARRAKNKLKEAIQQEGFTMERKDGRSYLLENFRPIKKNKVVTKSVSLKGLLKNIYPKDLFNQPRSVLIYEIDEQTNICDFVYCPLSLSMLESKITEINPRPIHILNFHSIRERGHKKVFWLNNVEFFLGQPVEFWVEIETNFCIHQTEDGGIWQKLRWANDKPNLIKRNPLVTVF